MILLLPKLLLPKTGEQLELDAFKEKLLEFNDDKAYFSYSYS